MGGWLSIELTIGWQADWAFQPYRSKNFLIEMNLESILMVHIPKQEYKVGWMNSIQYRCVEF
ncbi:MAG: hypothetical protein IJ217_05080 [Clostridia bacterium]|nr:hypothetical protein [Clostridia bacterium]